MMELPVWMVYILGYATVAWVSGAFVSKTFSLNPNDSAGPFLAGIFWPVVLPALAPCIIYKGAKAIRLPKTKSKQEKFLEIAQSPVAILSSLITQKIQRAPERLEIDYSKAPLNEITYYVWVCPSGNMVVRATDSKKSFRLSSITEIKINGKEVVVEAKPILEALNEAKEFNKQKRLAEEEKKTQLAALDAIEVLLSHTPEQEK